MNAFDYFFEKTLNLEKDLLLNAKESISYHNLYEQSIKLSGYLIDQIGVNQNILLIAPNSVFFMVAYLGVLKSGNVVVPLSTETEQGNLNFIQEICNPAMIISTSRVAAKLDFKEIPVIDEAKVNNILQSTANKQQTTYWQDGLQPLSDNQQ
ncbi:MAG: AMP-binding protein, partial [Bacteroidales bacterium]|nr:AMP-binding protein [Bacteroidales bacterium]